MDNSRNTFLLVLALLLSFLTTQDLIPQVIASDWPLFWPARLDFPVGDHPRSIAVGDFDADGNEDLAVANERSNDVAILIGNGDGSFETASFYGAGDFPRSVTIGDFDGDGKEDFAVANYRSANVAILMNNVGAVPPIPRTPFISR